MRPVNATGAMVEAHIVGHEIRGVGGANVKTTVTAPRLPIPTSDTAVTHCRPTALNAAGTVPW